MGEIYCFLNILRNEWHKKLGDDLFINCYVGQYQEILALGITTSSPYGRAFITALRLIFPGISLPSS